MWLVRRHETIWGDLLFLHALWFYGQFMIVLNKQVELLYPGHFFPLAIAFGFSLVDASFQEATSLVVVRTVNTAVIGADRIYGAKQSLLKRAMAGSIAPDADNRITGELLKELEQPVILHVPPDVFHFRGVHSQRGCPQAAFTAQSAVLGGGLQKFIKFPVKERKIFEQRIHLKHPLPHYITSLIITDGVVRNLLKFSGLHHYRQVV